MAKAGVQYLIATLVCGLISIAILCTSFATEYWLTSIPQYNDATIENSEVNYGLFFGDYVRINAFNKKDTYRLTLTCLITNGVCAWSCLSTEDKRTNEVEQLYAGNDVTFACAPTGSSDKSKQEQQQIKKNADRQFLEAGMWVSTIFFLAFSLLLSVIGCGITLLNIFSNPIETYCSLISLYVWFGCAVVSDLLVLILWGAEFGTRLSSNIAILDTIIGTMSSDGQSVLGYSYFMLLIPLVEHIMAIGFVYYRQYVLNKPGEQTIIKVDDKINDNNVFLY